jgi:hypothetical protein
MRAWSARSCRSSKGESTAKDVKRAQEFVGCKEMGGDRLACKPWGLPELMQAVHPVGKRGICAEGDSVGQLEQIGAFTTRGRQGSEITALLPARAGRAVAVFLFLARPLIVAGAVVAGAGGLPSGALLAWPKEFGDQARRVATTAQGGCHHSKRQVEG